jgi:uroporphyrinogen-III synthase
VPELTGVTVVVTRPQHQAQNLRTALEAAGAQVILFPTLEILPPVDPQPARALIDRIADYHIAIFISPNAVEFGLRELARVGGLPAHLQVAAVGAGTARALAAAGHAPELTPKEEFNSEALLALDALNHVGGKNILIFRGDGGRELLGDTLRARGANVQYAEVYRRAKPKIDPAPLFDAWSRNALDAIVVTSNESLENLFELVGTAGQSHLQRTQLFVASPRAAELAKRLGAERDPVVVKPMGDDAIVQALTRYARARRAGVPPRNPSAI